MLILKRTAASPRSFYRVKNSRVPGRPHDAQRERQGIHATVGAQCTSLARRSAYGIQSLLPAPAGTPTLGIWRTLAPVSTRRQGTFAGVDTFSLCVCVCHGRAGSKLRTENSASEIRLGIASSSLQPPPPSTEPLGRFQPALLAKGSGFRGRRLRATDAAPPTSQRRPQAVRKPPGPCDTGHLGPEAVGGGPNPASGGAFRA